jgi:hypothetical protein
MPLQWFPRSHAFSLAFLLFSSTAVAAAGQSLIGTWQGDVTLSGQRMPIRIVFNSDSSVLVDDGRPKQGTFVFDGKNIGLTLSTNDKPTVLNISEAQLTAASLRGKLHIQDDPAELISAIDLIRAPAGAVPPEPPPQSSGPCAAKGVSAKSASVLQRYGFDCPAALPAAIPDWQGKILASAFQEILNNQLGPKFQVRFTNEKEFTVGGDHSSMDEISRILVPLLADPAAVHLTAGSSGPCPPPLKCALRTVVPDGLKTEYLRHKQPDMAKIWTVIVKAANDHQVNLQPSQHLPPYESQTGLQERTRGPKGFVFELVKITLDDPGEPSAQEKPIQIEVKSQVYVKRSWGAEKAELVEDDCVIDSKTASTVRCSAQPILDQVLQEIMKPFKPFRL